MALHQAEPVHGRIGVLALFDKVLGVVAEEVSILQVDPSFLDPSGPMLHEQLSQLTDCDPGGFSELPFGVGCMPIVQDPPVLAQGFRGAGATQGHPTAIHAGVGVEITVAGVSLVRRGLMAWSLA